MVGWLCKNISNRVETVYSNFFAKHFALKTMYTKEGISINEWHIITVELLLFRYAGINASDINFSAGRYSPPNTPLPMDVGLEVSTSWLLCVL